MNYTGFVTAAYEKQGYLRLTAGEHVFYTDRRYFKDPAFLDRLTINQSLHLGVRRLDNGCYWIHWLSDNETLPEPSQWVTHWARPLLIINLSTLIVALIPLVMSTSEWGRFGHGIIMILASTRLLTGLHERLFHPALKRHPVMCGLSAKMAMARRRNFSFCQPLPATAKALRQTAMSFTQALPERYAVWTGKISNIVFKKWFAGNPVREYHGVGIQCDTAPLAFFWQNGSANFDLHPFSYRRQPPFLAIGDRIVAVYQWEDNDIQALYNVSDGGAFLKNHPCYPGDRQVSLAYNLFYDTVLVMYPLIPGMSLNNPYKPARGLWWLTRDPLDMLFLLLPSFGGILAVLELIGPTAWSPPRRVVDWLKTRSTMRRYLQGVTRHTALEEIMQCLAFQHDDYSFSH